MFEIIKEVRSFSVNVMYVPEHARAHYTMDNIHFGNGGDASEWVVKDSYNLPANKDACGAYDVTDDVPEYGATVKSSAATLVNRVLGESFDEIMAVYLDTVHSSVAWYAVPDFDKKMVTIYKMTMTAFEKYLRKFARYDASRKVIRLCKDNAKNIAWLNANARA